jgi:ribosomal protein S12
VGKALKYGHDGVITPLENMAEIVVTGGRIKKFDCVRWNLVQVRTKK